MYGGASRELADPLQPQGGVAGAQPQLRGDPGGARRTARPATAVRTSWPCLSRSSTRLRSESSWYARWGGATNVPLPGCCTISLSSLSSRSAWRSVMRVTP
nr:hypothetical protein GCM10020093_032540 [Planobispora longispora]